MKLSIIKLLLFALVGLNIACEPGETGEIVPNSPDDSIASPAPLGACSSHPLLGEWESSDVEGNTDRFTLFSDCTYTKTLTNESGFIDGASEHEYEEPNAVTNRGVTFDNEKFHLFQGSHADELLRIINPADLYRPAHTGLQVHRIGHLIYYHTGTELREKPLLRLFVKSWGMPMNTAYMTYEYYPVD